MNETELFHNLKGLLIDLDGTLYYKGKPTIGAIKSVSSLREKGLKLLFFTNTDSKSPKTIFKILQAYGFEIKEDEIFTPIIALKEFLSENPNKLSYFLTTKEVEKEFEEISKVKGNEIPDYVILGDFRDNWDVERLNTAFKYVLKGAKLLGTQGNRYFLDRNGEPVIDTGSFIQMIAYATNISPKIFGKPSKEYFLQAVRKINLPLHELVVIGDDLESDIQGAINSSIKGILVKTGKGQYFDPKTSKIKPFKVIESFSSIVNFFM